VSDEQPIDLDDLRRVSVKVREKTDDNWLADMVELACDEIARLKAEKAADWKAACESARIAAEEIMALRRQVKEKS